MAKIFLSTIVLLIVFVGNPFPILADEIILFPDQSLLDLTLIETDPESGSFSFLDNYGELHEGRLGDYIGVEEAKVSEVHDISIVVETYEEYEANNWDGTIITLTRTNSQTIPKARIMQGGKGGR